ncbi:Anti-sigma factor antagonist [Candidatus Terasakiella magnetica]|nr:Anti-sigma factor antagonist [Candidatus Terasakiella magnetica]
MIHTTIPAFTIPWPRLDLARVPALKDALYPLTVEGADRLIIDMSGVDFLDSSGLGALVSLSRKLGGRGTLALSGAREPVLSLLTMSRMDQVFVLASNIDAARKALGDGS